MKILKLVAENIKRLHCVSITPEGSLVTVAGKNGAGKSSVLDSISYAMGGEKLVPSEPIRAGESEAKIVVDLGDLVVTRKFKRTPVRKDEDKAATPDNIVGWSETTSTLSVTNKDGAKYPSPQAVLDKLLGRLTFDPLAFARAEPKDQDAILRKLVNLDVTAIEQRRKDAFDRRAMLKKTHAIKAAQLEAMPVVKDAPAEVIPVDAIADEMRRVDELRKVADHAEREVYKQAASLEAEVQRLAVQRQKIEDLESAIAIRQLELKQRQEDLGRFEEVKKEVEEGLSVKRVSAQEALAAVPDSEALRIKLKNTEVMNAAVRGNQKAATMQAEVTALVRDVDVEHQAILAAEAEKQAALAAAQFPVAGLGLSDDGVTFNNVPFLQAGSAEQVRVSVAIGIALNPQLKVLLIRNGNLLDQDSLKAVAAQAEAAQCQIWCEWVTDDANGMSVFIEDGAIV